MLHAGTIFVQNDLSFWEILAAGLYLCQARKWVKNMISVKVIPNPNRQQYYNQENPYLVSGIVSWRAGARPRVWRPPTDLYEIEGKIVVRVEIAGMSEGDFSISIDQNILSIAGVRPETGERRAYYQMEIPFGEFSTEVEVPSPINIDEVKAEYRDGFLLVTLPKAKPKEIKINKD
jgi:HSP20 family protein